MVVTLSSEEDFGHPEAGSLLRKYLAGRKGDVENRVIILRLIKNMVVGFFSVNCWWRRMSKPLSLGGAQSRSAGPVGMRTVPHG